ncbi:hypothetical protein F0L74_18700 [Chitinophaga agrisoli]|uniref:Uncharacterized protein n=1 Tax=Chitinophaga agrisoli TaxID=2607653 RepID=A0A5B2VRQ3_9BACT|nr:hypothetical protein [Chitinophaga agrisoli]KAA2241891.1 hypothetical protein F0L74_18700 [Chitinophaga agrisoli]
MQDFAFMTTEEHFLLQDALKKNKKQVRKFVLIGVIMMVIAAIVPQLLLYKGGGSDDADQSMFSYTNGWFWLWLICFVVVLVFALIKVTEVRYYTIKRDLMALQKGTIQARLDAVYHENNDTQTNFLVVLPNSKRKRLFYWTRGQLNDFRAGNEVEISYARYSRVVLEIAKKSGVSASHQPAVVAESADTVPVADIAPAAETVAIAESVVAADNTPVAGIAAVADSAPVADDAIVADDATVAEGVVEDAHDDDKTNS